MSQKRNSLFLLDAMALIYRAHFAFSKSPRITSTGLNTSAIYGFANTLLFDIIRKNNPTHIGVAFDTASPTFRHQEFEAYKAHREKQPEDITLALPHIRRMLNAMEIPILEMEGYEADDVIGTITKLAPADSFDVYMVTIDKDYAQLVKENVFFYKMAYAGKQDSEIWGIKEVLERWGIERTSQVQDILGLQGDASDNIPGIPGIGEKTAISLIKEYGTVENIIANAHKLKGKQRENVEKFAEQGILSKHLATICVDVPIAFEAEKLKLSNYKTEALSQLFDELEFRTIKNRIFEKAPVSTPNPAVFGGLFGEATPPPSIPAEENLVDDLPFDFTPEPLQNPIQRQTIHTKPHQYHLINSLEEQQELAEYLLIQNKICFDTETTSLDAFDAELVGISFAYLVGEAYYVPFPANRNEAQKILEIFRPVFEHENSTKIGQNIKYDMSVLGNYGIRLKGKLFDTMLAHYLIEPDMRHNMDALAESYLNYSPIPIDSLIGKKGKNQGNMRNLSPEEIKDYACEDADITLQLALLFEEKIKERNQEKLLFEVEMPLVEVLSDMERAGVKINEEALKNYSSELDSILKETEKNIHIDAGEEFNIASPKQLGDILFEKMKLDPEAKKTSKTKQYATGEEILSKLENKHPIIPKILEYRELQKLKSTYVDALPLMVSKRDGLIHTSYNQAVASTGRLSSTNPNLQNIPIRTNKGKEIRKAFVPRNEDFVLLSADYSQIELRIMATFAHDQSMIQAFKRGDDIHAMTASKIYKVPLEKVDSEMRRKAKTANFGIIYGISAHGLSQRLNIPRGEAGELIRSYFVEFPSVKNYMDNVVNQAREREYVETIMGRRRYLRDINSRNQTVRGFAERNAINAPIQGSAADIIKLAMIQIHQWLKKENLRSKMILQVHDELVFDIHKSELEQIKPTIIHLMQSAFEMEVPLVVEAGTGTHWLEAH